MRPKENGFLNYKNAKIRFAKFGHGKKLLIALHGFGDRAEQFLALASALENDYTVYAIDLPHHGKTQWQHDSFSKENLTDWFDLILKKEQKSHFELMGFSFGGRIILSMLSDGIKKIDKIYLVAPDGIQTKGMFNALLVPLWLRRMLKNRANHPDWLVTILKIGFKLGLLSKFNFNFIKNNITTEERRNRIFNTWLSLNNFKVDLKKAKSFLKEKEIPVMLYSGSRDKIIPPEAAKKLCSEMPNIQLNIIESGHLLLNGKLNKCLKDQLEKA